MNNLQEARDMIRSVDAEMAALFQKRMEAVKIVASYKREHGLPVLDEAQEQRVIDRNSQYIEDPDMRDYYIQFIKDTMLVSRKYQHRLLEGLRVAYSGIVGAFAQVATARIFPDCIPIPCASFEEAYESVEKGECDCCVLPIENSYAGEVGQVVDLMFSGNLYVNGVFDLPVMQNLLGVPGSSLEDITTVISHPQALGQCDNYLNAHGYIRVKANNTARAASEVAERNDIHVAAIANIETAGIYGLKVLDRDINDNKNNTTRFAVFSRVENREVGERDGDSFILMFDVKDEAGSLANSINIISAYGYNMNVLRSRPTKDETWKYYFYVQAQGDERSENGQRMLEKLSKYCDKLKVVGRYTAYNTVLKEGVTR